jgi:hypothetical protein
MLEASGIRVAAQRMLVLDALATRRHSRYAPNCTVAAFTPAVRQRQPPPSRLPHMRVGSRRTSWRASEPKKCTASARRARSTSIHRVP